MSDMSDLRARLNAIGEAFVRKDRSVIARTIAEAMAELELAREAKLCLIDLVLECNPRNGEYSVPSRELIEWAHRIIRRGYRKESDA